MLCGLILLSRLAPDMQVKVGNLTYVQPDFEQAALSLGPVSFSEAQFAARARADDITDVLASRNDSNLTGVPNAIFPLEIYLLYAREQGIAPFDGTFLAVAPSTPAVYQLLNDSIPWFNTSVGEYDRPKGSSKALRIRYYDDGDALVAAALKGSSIWCGLIFDGVPPAANWSFTLRLNHSLVPPTAHARQIHAGAVDQVHEILRVGLPILADGHLQPDCPPCRQCLRQQCIPWQFDPQLPWP